MRWRWMNSSKQGIVNRRNQTTTTEVKKLNENESELLQKHWNSIRDGIIFDLKMIDATSIKSLEIVRSLEPNRLKVEIYCKQKKEIRPQKPSA